MKISQVIGLGLIALGVVAAVRAAEYAPGPDAPTFDPHYTPVDVDAQAHDANEASGSIELPTTVIVASVPRKARPVRQTAQCGAFQFRALEQGSGNVRGFCGGAL